MSLLEMKFILFNIGSTDETIREQLDALDSKFDNLAQVIEGNFKAITDGIDAIKLQNAIDFSATGAGIAEQNIHNQLDKFERFVRLRENLKAKNGSKEKFKALADRLSRVLQEAHKPLQDNLPKLRRALEGSLASAQASSGGVLCDVSTKAETQVLTTNETMITASSMKAIKRISEMVMAFKSDLAVCGDEMVTILINKKY